MEGYLGEIRFFAGNFIPKDWAFCHGQLLAISEYGALFSVLGIEYGGDGHTNFRLPDFRGRTIIAPDSRIGLNRGYSGGQEEISLNYVEMPAHTHHLRVDNNNGNRYSPSVNVFAKPVGEVTIGRDLFPINSTSYSSNRPALVNMNEAVISSVGKGQPHNNMQPFLGINYIICIQGNYPSKN